MTHKILFSKPCHHTHAYPCNQNFWLNPSIRPLYPTLLPLPKSIPTVFDLQHPTPAGESLTFVVTLLDQDAWLYSGYRYSSPTMIYIINRVLSSNFPATIVSNIHDVTPLSSSTSTPFSHTFRTMSRNFRSPHSASRNPLEHNRPSHKVSKLFHLWIFSRSPC